MTENVQLVHNATLMPHWTGEGLLHDGAIAWNGKTILAIDGSATLLEAYPQAERLDLKGCLLAPGLVNAHHHIYSALAAGLDPAMPIASFSDCLQRLWWRLDRALDADTIRLSAKLTALRCIQSGCTTLFDHHASPSLIASSLDLIHEELNLAGLSAVLSYEMTDRNGHQQAREGLEASTDFARRMKNNSRFRGMIGLHALFTLSEESLKAASIPAQEFGSHIHVAEGSIDGELCKKHHGIGLVERLHRHNLLSDKSLIIHGLHLGADELQALSKNGSWLVTNPESNANNQVGFLNLKETSPMMPRLLLGTDGMSSDMIASLKSAFLLQRQNSNHELAGWLGTEKLLARNADLAAHFFDDPHRGRLVVGAPADFAVWNYRPQETFGPSTLLSDLVYGVSQSHVQHTVSHGRWLMRDGVVQTIDQDSLHLHLQKTQPDLWRRFHAQPAETHFLGSLAN